MIFTKMNQTLVATALLVTSMMLGAPTAEGLLQEKQGNLRRQLDADPSPNSSPSRVELLTAGKFAILSKTGVSTVGTTSVTGVMGTSPIAATALTGFGLIADSSNTFSTSSLVSGSIYAADYAPPTPNMLTVAVLDMQAAYVDAAGRKDPDHTELGSAGSIEGLTLEPGLYKWSTDVGFTSSLTFNGKGDDTAIWILQIDGDVKVGSGAEVILRNGAKAENIFWQIAGSTEIGTYSRVEGIFMCNTKIMFKTGSSMNGAALAQTAVTMEATTIVKKSVCDATVGCIEG
eukprot:scaffold743_cov183-Chaetoceros_neogracile.AAC.2